MTNETETLREELKIAQRTADKLAETAARRLDIMIARDMTIHSLRAELFKIRELLRKTDGSDASLTALDNAVDAALTIGL